MSIWSTFKTLTVHDTDHSERDADCGCGDATTAYLSSAWYGFPLRLSIRSGDDMHADCALTRDQASELGRELLAWAERDQVGARRMGYEREEGAPTP